MKTVGIDLADGSVKIAKIQSRFGSANLLALCQHELPEGLIVNGVVQDNSAVAVQIRTCMETARPQPMKISSAFFSVPESVVFTHMFSFPKELDSEAVQTGIEVQFSEYFPRDIREMAYDWKVVQTSDQTQMVLVAACDLLYVRQIQDLAKALHIKCLGIDIESACCARSLLPPAKDVDSHALVAVEDDVTTLSIFSKEGLQTTMTLRMSAAKLQNRSLFDQTIQPVIAELDRMIDFFQESYQRQVKSAYLSGSRALLDGMLSYLQGHVLRVPIQLGDPRGQLSHAAPLSEYSSGVLFAGVIGLALGADRKFHQGRFNLLESAVV